MHRRTSGIGQVLAAVSLVIATLAVPGAPALAAGPAPAGGVAPVPAAIAETDQVVIRWAQPLDVARSATPARVAQLGAASGRRLAFVRRFQSASSIYRLPARLGAAAPQILAALARVPGVASVEADPRATVDALPNDSYASQLWGLLGTANGSPYGIDALGGWSITQGSGVTVAVIDTGITGHPDLAGQTVAGYDFISDPVTANDGDGRDPDPSDPGDWVTTAESLSGPLAGCTVTDSSWHGTHVAGTIAALANNSTGVFGGAPQVKIEPVRALGRCGGYFSDLEDAITWASGGTVAGAPPNLNPARVLNLSLGADGLACDSTMQGAINGAIANGSIVVVAAGNSGMNVSTSAPANCAGVFSVAATDINGQRPSFSNYGAGVSIAAPGVGIISTLNDGATGPASPAYASYDGTSMATPHVALTAALLAARYPLATSAQIEAAIRAGATAFPAGSTCISLGCGAGIDNVPGALAALAPPTAIWTPPVSPANAATLAYGLTFSKPVSGLVAADFAVTGSATGCAVGAPVGSGASYTVSVGSCTSGTVSLTLKANTVTDAVGNTGPAADLTAPPAATLLCTPGQGPTNATSLACSATFSEPPGPGSAFDAAGVLVGGSTTGWVVGAPAGSGTGPYAFSVAGGSAGGTLTVAIRAGAITDGAGNPTMASASLVLTIDRTAPTATVPTTTPRAGIALAGSAIPVSVAWSGTDSLGGTGVVRYELARSVNGGTWATLSSSLTSPSFSIAVAASGTVQFRVRAVDRAGNVGAWMTGPALTPRLFQQAATGVRYSGAWYAVTGSAFSGSSAKYGKSAGASVTYVVTGPSVALVTTKAPSRGKVRVYVNGVLAATVDLYAARTTYRVLAWQRTWSTSASRTIRLVVVGTSGRPRVDLDAFAVLK